MNDKRAKLLDDLAGLAGRANDVASLSQLAHDFTTIKEYSISGDVWLALTQRYPDDIDIKLNYLDARSMLRRQGIPERNEQISLLRPVFDIASLSG